jgi:succinate dehydrogenase / fumarate reductase iron-sulfur subunit
MQVRFRVKRFNPERDKGPHWEEYDVPMEPTDRVLDGLHHVKWYIAGTLTRLRASAHGVCGSDAKLINGRNQLACKLLMKDVGRKVTVEPLRGMRVIKDLVVDMEPFFEKYRSILPYLINDDPPPDRERLQSPEDRARYDDTTKCILCAACTTSCPIYWADAEYVGPAAIVQAHRFIFDSRDQGAARRAEVLAERSGVFRCKTTFNCTDACPRGIEVTRAIQEVKQALLLKRV